MFKRLLLKLFLKYEEVFFVGATDKLPPPLSKEEELKYLVLAKSGDNYAKDKLIEHNLRLVVFLAKKYETTGYDIEDLVSIGSIGLIKGINTYKIVNLLLMPQGVFLMKYLCIFEKIKKVKMMFL